MSFHEGSKWQERMEDAKKYKEDTKSFTTPLTATPVIKEKPFTESNVRGLLQQYNNAEISFSKLVELMNEAAGYKRLPQIKI